MQARDFSTVTARTSPQTSVIKKGDYAIHT
jgi:hypothetical protein